MVKLATFFELDIKAPPSFCYEWLTDYQPTDSQINPALTSRKVERKGNIVHLQDESLGPPLNRRVAEVHLSPPDAWDVAAKGSVYDYDLHYRVSATPGGAKLTIVGTIDTKPGSPFKTREESHARFVKAWAYYKDALEADYKKGKTPA